MKKEINDAVVCLLEALGYGVWVEDNKIHIADNPKIVFLNRKLVHIRKTALGQIVNPVYRLTRPEIALLRGRADQGLVNFFSI